jgi:hypothetical protein
MQPSHQLSLGVVLGLHSLRLCRCQCITRSSIIDVAHTRSSTSDADRTSSDRRLCAASSAARSDSSRAACIVIWR